MAAVEEKGRLLNTKEAAELLGCTEKKIRALCKKGELQYSVWGNRYKLFSDDIRKYSARAAELREYPVIRWHFISREGQANPLQTVRAQNICGYLEEICELVQRITAAGLKANKTYRTKRLCGTIQAAQIDNTLEIQIARRKDVEICGGELIPLPQKRKKRRWNEKCWQRADNGRFEKRRE